MRAKYHLLLATFVIALLPSCAGYRMHKADEAYNLMAFERAQKRYDRLLQRSLDRTALIRCADACRRQNELADAAQRYHRADSIAPLSGEDAFRYGQVLMGLGRPDEAEASFFRVLEAKPEDAAALDLYESCQAYRDFLHDSDAFVVNRLNLPGFKSVFSAAPFQRGLLVTGEPLDRQGRANPWNGRSFLDLYYVEKKTVVRWLEPVRLPGEVNGPYHEGTSVVSADGNTMFFTRSDYYKQRLNKDERNTSHLKLFRATRDSITQAWTDIRAFAYNGEHFSCGHPALSADGNTLYFVSDMPGGQGGSDIWRSTRDGGGWNTPENLGATVNTAGNEAFPVVNGDALYFSSDAHHNLGGLDIFETHQTGEKWTEPRNLNYPVNTEHDDFSLVIDKRVGIAGDTTMSGYLSSSREGTDQVYTFWAVAPVFMVEGEVTDIEGNYLPNVEVTLAELLTEEDTSVMTGPDGRFRFPLKPGSDYTVRASDEAHLSQSHPLSTRGLLRSDTLRVDFHLSAISVDEPVAIQNILYDYDKWDIRPDAARELDKLAKIFKDNPHMSFELGAHTDSRGGDTYNLVLSDARAYSAVNYLIQQGVDPDRISAKGFGETVLKNDCRNGVKCTEEAHQENRRTEFRVTGIKNLAQER